ncbi:hypothetical protein [Deinococcus yavapaiensis]|uniref:Uncharacterized protein n=1 Tax=Deinococcus yavapaiensis KR-236 TaxID=694435 RepID=A0A318S7C4_9DEIO|nr:hypothetical protein [Deinococcus yavapaiensis]PYE53786.1 hypothetical protein DES52_10744 [Deinococcus yavapaiensis KR-236]
MSNFTLKGRWHIDSSETSRHFVGKVQDPGVTGLRPGDVVTVTYQHQHDRFVGHTNDSHVQGGYSLEGMPSQTFVLASFLRKDGVVGREAEHAGEEQLWGGDLYDRASLSPS